MKNQIFLKTHHIYGTTWWVAIWCRQWTLSSLHSSAVAFGDPTILNRARAEFVFFDSHFTKRACVRSITRNICDRFCDQKTHHDGIHQRVVLCAAFQMWGRMQDSKANDITCPTNMVPSSDRPPPEISYKDSKRKLSGAWSFMSPPSKKDVVGNRKVCKAFDAPKKTFDNLIVLDFEWTCDKVRFGPSEIIEFPSVLLSGDRKPWDEMIWYDYDSRRRSPLTFQLISRSFPFWFRIWNPTIRATNRKSEANRVLQNLDSNYTVTGRQWRWIRGNLKTFWWLAERKWSDRRRWIMSRRPQQQ